jgi:hypothetical protein
MCAVPTSLGRRRSQDKHLEQVTFLKEQHGMGHGHANAVVAVYRAERGQ